MSCFTNSVSNCLNAQSLQFNYGYIYPLAPYKGTIVFLSGGDGTTPSRPEDQEQMFADYYYKAGYEIVQVAWSSPWEQTDVPAQSNTPYVPNIQLAACRQATFLNFVRNSLFTSGGGAGMCVQATSAGSAAVAYSLAYYGAGNNIDTVELLSGPVLSNIEQGCGVGNGLGAPVTICGQNNGSQIGCKLGGLAPWTLSPTYTGAKDGVRSWTYDNSCAGSQQTSTGSNLAWYQMSIVDDGTNNPTFSYPTTAMSAWLCQSLQGQLPPNQCTPLTQQNQNYCPNNSSPQGQIFYAAITANGNTPLAPYTIYGVRNCGGPEGVGAAGSDVPGYPDDPSGFSAIESDMLSQCKHPQ